jgi:hypothetical protein
MRRTNREEIAMTKKLQKTPPGDVLRFEVGGHLLWNSMALSDYFVVMALCRRGPSTSAEVAREVSTWLENPLRPDGLNRALHMVVGLGWARHTDGIYAIKSEGIEIMRGCHIAFMRMLGGDPTPPEAAVLKCFIEEFERS